MPPRPRYVGMPLSADIPAPVKKTMRSKSRNRIVTFASLASSALVAPEHDRPARVLRGQRLQRRKHLHLLERLYGHDARLIADRPPRTVAVRKHPRRDRRDPDRHDRVLTHAAEHLGAVCELRDCLESRRL